jgi:hypothetical protein
MKRALILTAILFLTLLAYSQNQITPPHEFMKKLGNINQSGMLVLGSWGLANMAAGGILSFTQQGTSKYFWQMNMAWNTVNVAIAAFGYWGASNDWSSTSEIIKAIDSPQKAYLFNAGLDVGYIMTGFYLKELAKRKPAHANRLTGYGNSIVLQGAFLFAFDLAMYSINQQYININVQPWFNSLNSISGLSLSYSF